jgi:Amt family ammonium transporter
LCPAFDRVDVIQLSNGILAGLVAITAGCDTFSSVSALAVGTVAGGLVYPLAHMLVVSLHVDDVVDAVPGA